MRLESKPFGGTKTEIKRILISALAACAVFGPRICYSSPINPVTLLTANRYVSVSGDAELNGAVPPVHESDSQMQTALGFDDFNGSVGIRFDLSGFRNGDPNDPQTLRAYAQATQSSAFSRQVFTLSATTLGAWTRGGFNGEFTELLLHSSYDVSFSVNHPVRFELQFQGVGFGGGSAGPEVTLASSQSGLVASLQGADPIPFASELFSDAVSEDLSGLTGLLSRTENGQLVVPVQGVSGLFLPGQVYTLHFDEQGDIFGFFGSPSFNANVGRFSLRFGVPDAGGAVLLFGLALLATYMLHRKLQDRAYV
jgi:hypothetical protein